MGQPSEFDLNEISHKAPHGVTCHSQVARNIVQSAAQGN